MIALPNLLAGPCGKWSISTESAQLRDLSAGWILFDDTGLEGPRGAVGSGKYRGRISRAAGECWVDGPDFQQRLQACEPRRLHRGLRTQKTSRDQTVGAVGLQRDHGIIARALGLGIAFPQYATDPWDTANTGWGCRSSWNTSTPSCHCGCFMAREIPWGLSRRSRPVAANGMAGL